MGSFGVPKRNEPASESKRVFCYLPKMKKEFHGQLLAVLTFQRRCYGIKTERLQDGATDNLHA